MAAACSVSPDAWRQVCDQVVERIAGRFRRVEPRRTARELLWGLISPVERKNSWWLAEHAGHRSPDKMQRLLPTAVWDDRKVRDDLCGFVVEQLGHTGGVLVADETGF